MNESVHSTALKENLDLIDDPALRGPSEFPWAWVTFGILAVLAWGAFRFFCRLQPASVPAQAPPAPPEVENSLAALEAAYAKLEASTALAAIEAFDAVIRRDLGRRLGSDVAALTTTEISHAVEGPALPGPGSQAIAEEEGRSRPSGGKPEPWRDAFPGLRRSVLLKADLHRFAGVPADIGDAEAIYCSAREYVERSERIAVKEAVS